MAIETALRSVMVNDATLAALVGTRVTDGHRLQASAFPAITLEVITGERDGVMSRTWPEYHRRVQATIWAQSTGSKVAVYEALLGAVERYAGTQGDIEILFIEHAGETDAYTEDERIYSRAVDLMVHWRAAA